MFLNGQIFCIIIMAYQGGYALIISEDEIRQVAINLLKVHNIDTSSAIDIKELITSSGKEISWMITDLKGINGFTCYNSKKDSYRMFFDEALINNCPARLNFTMAHEFGHIILNHFTDSDNSLQMHYKQEREANIFVDELLMPTVPIMKYQLNAREISETYNVSLTAAQNKIRYLKTNNIYLREKAIFHAIRIVSKYSCLSYDDYNDRMVKKLHDAWLDPDYDFGF